MAESNIMRGAISWAISSRARPTRGHQRLADRVAALTGIDRPSAAGWMAASRFPSSARIRPAQRQVTGRYDASVSGFDSLSGFELPSFRRSVRRSLTAPLTSAAVDVTTRKLNWRPDGSYQLLDGAGQQSLGFRAAVFNPAEVDSQLRRFWRWTLTEAVGGARLFDLATPYFGSKILLDQLRSYASPDRA